MLICGVNRYIGLDLESFGEPMGQSDAAVNPLSLGILAAIYLPGRWMPDIPGMARDPTFF